jgi:hypothetical protein
MPAKRQGRFVTSTPEELNAWFGRQSGKPVHVATETTDLAPVLKRGLVRNLQSLMHRKRNVDE